jgi:hypothetical protein
MRTFEELTRKEQLELFEAYLDDKVIEVIYNYAWEVIKVPLWYKKSYYRVALSKPNINWLCFKEDYKWLYKDENNHLWLSVNKPVVQYEGWNCLGNTEVLPVCLLNLEKGSCYWRDSLVERPLE